MTTAMDFLEPRIFKRRCDHSNDLENPLLEATISTAEGEHKQERSKEDPSTPRLQRLLLASFVALFIETMAITIGQQNILLFYLVGVTVAIVDVILIRVIFVVMANYFHSS